MFPLFYFIFLLFHIFFFFFPPFFSSTHIPLLLLFFSLFPSFLFFPITSSTRVILRYSQSTKNNAPSFHMRDHHFTILRDYLRIFSSTHMPLLFFFISFFHLFPYHFTLHNVPHRAKLFLPLSFSIFFLPFLLPLHLQFSFLPSIPSKHTNFLSVLLIKTLPSKCISQIRLDINKIF